MPILVCVLRDHSSRMVSLLTNGLPSRPVTTESRPAFTAAYTASGVTPMARAASARVIKAMF